MTTSLLRVCTAGSVDDGKSTLIGRLLFDAKALMTDQLGEVEEASRRRGFLRTELALVTDGLRAEREQGITIDVAWRYFAVPGRRFILADTPGHVQYTRNMVTGASTADVALVLIDARHALTEQSRRHLHLASLLDVPYLVVVINKMDQVEFSFDRFVEVRDEVASCLDRLHWRGPRRVAYVPISALHGDNVVTRSTRTPYYEGPTLLEHLGALDVTRDVDDEPFRLPVQWIIRPQSDAHHDYRGIAGRIASGRVRVADELTFAFAPGSAKVCRIEHGGVDVTSAERGASVILHLDGDHDLSRGELLTSGPPLRAGRQLVADLAWFAPRPAVLGKRYALKLATRTVRMTLTGIEHVLDVASGETKPATELGENGIARVTLETSEAIAWEPYLEQRVLGSAIVIDEATSETVGAVLLR